MSMSIETSLIIGVLIICVTIIINNIINKYDKGYKKFLVDKSFFLGSASAVLQQLEVNLDLISRGHKDNPFTESDAKTLLEYCQRVRSCLKAFEEEYSNNK